MDRPEILMTPGPTPVPPTVLQAQGSPLVYHRGPGYGRLLREVTAGLKAMLDTEADVLLFTSSGTGGLESAVANLFSPGDRVVVPVAGYFGDRFARIAEVFGLDVRRLEDEWGSAARADALAEALDEAPTRGVLAQHSETSTGVIHDIEALGKVTKDAGALFVVDVISSLGAVPYRGDAWGVDVAVGGSQKALGATPGIAFVSVSDAAWAATRRAKNPRFYFDWAAYKRSYDLPDPESPWTPAISLMLGLREALRLFQEEGQEAVLERHRILSEATKEGIRALGLDLDGEHPERAWAVTAVRAPEGVDGNELVARVRRDHGIVLAPGQGPLKGKVFRIGHLGHYDRFDIIRCLAALELTLGDMGYPVKRGAGVAAAEETFARRR
ncbi:MAG TPA: alanine--glyoxylate aminotransferase family protein [Actinomycetota bacterium]|jgi:aspartate aminotransferase-like enzyme|nr:alanine--glyoxylate aminotransferase family protein [Actinomycetota bacterium]